MGLRRGARALSSAPPAPPPAPPPPPPLSRAAKARLDNLLSRRAFVFPAFELHGGSSGLFDLGPPGVALKENVLALWRQHFVAAEGLLQLEGPALTPLAVLRASGHAARFADLMVRCAATGECFRADKLLEEAVARALQSPPAVSSSSTAASLGAALTPARRDELRRLAARAGALSPDELHEALGALGVRAPGSGAALSRPFAFNLMFETRLGPGGAAGAAGAAGAGAAGAAGVAFLRPETAQGIFVNFRRLLDFAGGRLPFGAAQVGAAFRNEIAPRGGLVRAREFAMAEIEFFVHPLRKRHARFADVAGERLVLLTAASQEAGGGGGSGGGGGGGGDAGAAGERPTLGEAVARGLVDSETLAYFMARTAAFLRRLGVRPEGLRFRQHMKGEQAHYARECWDAEVLLAQGWVECVGLADRGSYDLEAHAAATGVELAVREQHAAPGAAAAADAAGSAVGDDELAATFVARPNRSALGRAFRSDQIAVLRALDALAAAGGARAAAFAAQLAAAGAASLDVAVAGEGGGAPRARAFTLTREMVDFAVEATQPGATPRRAAGAGSAAAARRSAAAAAVVPHVIEPSFGIGRIITALLEHSFYVRGDAAEGTAAQGDGDGGGGSGGSGELSRAVLALPPQIAPWKCVVLPLDGRVDATRVSGAAAALAAAGVSSYVDDSAASIGRRYARADELGTPFALTVDFETAQDGAVTLRERDSTRQVRLPAARAAEAVRALCAGALAWGDVEASARAA